jgi:hypothetical protein
LEENHQRRYSFEEGLMPAVLLAPLLGFVTTAFTGHPVSVRPTAWQASSPAIALQAASTDVPTFQVRARAWLAFLLPCAARLAPRH